jgi:hypothetical protein
MQQQPVFNNAQAPTQQQPVFNNAQAPTQQQPVFNNAQAPMQQQPVFNNAQAPLEEEPVPNNVQASLEQQDMLVTDRFEQMVTMLRDIRAIEQRELENVRRELAVSKRRIAELEQDALSFREISQFMKKKRMG